ncbi:hypothetical protein DXK94_07825 [Arthrobacter sp. RT-1]|jgi:hypothetical protein|uniref:hypothetical protein n=1 Tax=Arthrobacter sp. RT-1 TaxID=2292263 RepID=UPI000E1F8651|nr:hypothetical protein [Arthrobacter sp. RT-1]RDV10442.1 hypothetical protein DXK94_07825 [Arthrobacter sp. RT-1]
MDAWVPLFQTALWIAFLLSLGRIFRPEISDLRTAIRDRLRKGAPVKFGEWLELGGIQQEVRDLRGQIDDLSQRVAVLFLSTMSPTMYTNLRKLESGHFDLSSPPTDLSASFSISATLGISRSGALA